MSPAGRWHRDAPPGTFEMRTVSARGTRPGRSPQTRPGRSPQTRPGRSPQTRAGAGEGLGVAGAWLGLFAAVSYVLAFNPTDRVSDPAGPCLWHRLSDIDGPLCGGTRMVWYLLHGDLVQAARHHLIALVGVPVAVYALLAWTLRVSLGRRWPLLRLPRWVYIAYAVAWLLYSVVLRNLPWSPFTWFFVADLT